MAFVVFFFIKNKKSFTSQTEHTMYGFQVFYWYNFFYSLFLMGKFEYRIRIFVPHLIWHHNWSVDWLDRTNRCVRVYVCCDQFNIQFAFVRSSSFANWTIFTPFLASLILPFKSVCCVYSSIHFDSLWSYTIYTLQYDFVFVIRIQCLFNLSQQQRNNKITTKSNKSKTKPTTLKVIDFCVYAFLAGQFRRSVSLFFIAIEFETILNP